MPALANNDKPKIIALVQLYKKIYSILAIGIFILGLSLYPFLGILMNEGGNIPFISIIYIIFQNIYIKIQISEFDSYDKEIYIYIQLSEKYFTKKTTSNVKFP